MIPYKPKLFRQISSEPIFVYVIIKDRPLIDREKRIDRFHHISDKENNGGVTGTLIAFISPVYFTHDDVDNRTNQI